MEDCMRECMRKLALWYTRTFKPIITHDELEPIMAILGFVAVNPRFPPNVDSGATVWREYFYSAGCYRSQSPAEPPPRPRLPYPRIDGLHIYTYRAFLDAVNFYLEMSDISDLFHIRGMPLHRVHDRSKKWRRIKEDDSVFVYGEGTLDQAVYNFYLVNKNNDISISRRRSNSSNKGCNSTIIRKRGNSTPAGCVVPLKDIV